MMQTSVDDDINVTTSGSSTLSSLDSPWREIQVLSVAITRAARYRRSLTRISPAESQRQGRQRSFP
jgi:hypothetical protein